MPVMLCMLRNGAERRRSTLLARHRYRVFGRHVADKRMYVDSAFGMAATCADQGAALPSGVAHSLAERKSAPGETAPLDADSATAGLSSNAISRIAPQNRRGGGVRGAASLNAASAATRRARAAPASLFRWRLPPTGGRYLELAVRRLLANTTPWRLAAWLAGRPSGKFSGGGGNGGKTSTTHRLATAAARRAKRRGDRHQQNAANAALRHSVAQHIWRQQHSIA